MCGQSKEPLVCCCSHLVTGPVLGQYVEVDGGSHETIDIGITLVRCQLLELSVVSGRKLCWVACGCSVLNCW